MPSFLYPDPSCSDRRHRRQQQQQQQPRRVVRLTSSIIQIVLLYNYVLQQHHDGTCYSFILQQQQQQSTTTRTITTTSSLSFVSTSSSSSSSLVQQQQQEQREQQQQQNRRRWNYDNNLVRRYSVQDKNQITTSSSPSSLVSNETSSTTKTTGSSSQLLVPEDDDDNNDDETIIIENRGMTSTSSSSSSSSSSSTPSLLSPVSSTGPLIDIGSEYELPDDFDTECLIPLVADDDDNNDEDDSETDEENCLPIGLVTLPRHSNPAVNTILQDTEQQLRTLHSSSSSTTSTKSSSSSKKKKNRYDYIMEAKERGTQEHNEVIHANNYVDLGKIDTIGFDFDYTLVTYTDELLELIYDKALQRLVSNRQYPKEMISSEAQMKYDPFFSIRGLAVDKETGWITHLSYTHKVAVAWEGRTKVPSSRIFEEYRGKRALRPSERKKRLKPLNDIFSMAECCLIADTIQFFQDYDIPYYPQNVVTDVLKAITDAHLSGEFHRIVAANPEIYFAPTPHLKDVLTRLKLSGKRLIFVSNSPFWYVDAGMKYVLGNNWIHQWDAIITTAGKPNFYTDEARPFREICQETNSIKFMKVHKLEPGKIYTEGCLKELTRLMDWNHHQYDTNNTNNNKQQQRRIPENDEPQLGLKSGTHEMGTPHALYIGDSLFADLVDAKREFGWTTAAVTPEVGYENEIQQQHDFVLATTSIDILLQTLRTIQSQLGNNLRTEEDMRILDSLERLVSLWRDRETSVLGNPFGSVFRARYQPSLFAHSLKRYCDLYMTSVSCLRHYSPQHRFYPEQKHRLLAHEMEQTTTTTITNNNNYRNTNHHDNQDDVNQYY